MKLFLLSQSVIDGYDVYDSCVVVAEDAIDASTIHPRSTWSGKLLRINPDETNFWPDWPNQSGDISVKYLGEAAPSFTSPSVICASFNAG